MTDPQRAIHRRQLAAEAAVPAELRDTYADLLHDYTTAARSHGDTSVPNFAILVDLVRNGWRKASRFVSPLDEPAGGLRRRR